MAHHRFPSFFKILLDPSAPHLPLPTDFVSKHLEHKVPKDLTVRYAKGRYSWKLKIKKIGESLCLCDGWESVVEDIQLGFGDFLVFRVVDKFVFKLVVYSPNGCEKEFVHNNNNNTHVVEDNNNININNDNVVVEDDEDDDDDDDVEYEDGDGDRDRDRDEDEDGDEDEDEDEEDVEGYEEKEDEEDEDEDDEDEDEGGIDGNDGDPFFMINISKAHKYMMRLPPDFVELAGIEDEGTLTVANVDGKEWELGVRVEKHNKNETYCLSAGWGVFRQSNDICEGDECVFKFLRNEDKLLLARVAKNKRPARHPFGKKTTKGVAKRKREQAEHNSRQVSASKVVSEDEDEIEDEIEDEEKEDDVNDEDQEKEDDAHEDEGDPFFSVNTSKTHMSMMRLPMNFVELAGIDGKRTLTAVNVEGKEWQLGLRVDKYQKNTKYCLSAGWRDFWRSNGICQGDECVFKYLRSEDKLLLEKVTKNKRLLTQSVDKKVANGVAKRKREQPERNSKKGPARKVVTRATRGGGNVESVKGVKRSRGRPAKRLRGRPAKRK